MALQLKGGNNDNNKDSDSSAINALDRKNADPWGNKDIEDDIYEENLSRMKEEAHVAARNLRHKRTGIIITVLTIGVIIGLIFFAKNYISSKINPEIIDLTPYAGKDEKILSDELDVELTESDEWLANILFWLGDQGRQLEIHANEDMGVFYIDGRQTGLFVHEKNYELYGIRVGMGDKKALEVTTFPYKENDYFVVEEDMNEGKNTTYYYFDKGKNDCIGITKNDTTNIVEGIMYIDNYQVFSKDLKQE